MPAAYPRFVQASTRARARVLLDTLLSSRASIVFFCFCFCFVLVMIVVYFVYSGAAAMLHDQFRQSLAVRARWCEEDLDSISGARRGRRDRQNWRFSGSRWSQSTEVRRHAVVVEEDVHPQNEHFGDRDQGSRILTIFSLAASCCCCCFARD